MWVQERHDRIVALLNERQRLTTEMFAAELGVSKETIRRDLIELELSGKLARVHGGAIPQTLAPHPASAPRQAPGPVASAGSAALPEAAYVERNALHHQEKAAIAHVAAARIERGMCCYMDAGSTTLALARELAGRTGLRIVTNSVDIAAALARQPGLDVMLLGGHLDGDLPATFGEQTLADIARERVDLALISPVALDPQRGAMNYLWHEAAVARAMVAQAERLVLLADASKLGAVSRAQICPLPAVHLLVTDDRAEPALLQRLRVAGVAEIAVAPARSAG